MFAQTKSDCERLAKEIHHANIRVMAFHGGRTQPSREIALEKFKKGELRVSIRYYYYHFVRKKMLIENFEKL